MFTSLFTCYSADAFVVVFYTRWVEEGRYEDPFATYKDCWFLLYLRLLALFTRLFTCVCANAFVVEAIFTQETEKVVVVFCQLGRVSILALQ